MYGVKREEDEETKFRNDRQSASSTEVSFSTGLNLISRISIGKERIQSNCSRLLACTFDFFAGEEEERFRYNIPDRWNVIQKMTSIGDLIFDLLEFTGEERFFFFGQLFDLPVL